MTGTSPFDELLAQSRELEARARQIQADSELGLTEAEIDDLVGAYHSWLARALEALPEDYRDAFRFEYEGNFFQHRIKSFFESPGEPNPLYDPANNPLGLSRWQHPFDDRFRGPLMEQRRMLTSAKEEVEGEGSYRLSLDLVERLARGLPDFLVPLSSRYDNRPPFVIEDEYDLQDLVHGLLKIFFDDVRAEDFAPERAGGRSRIDFVLKAEKTVVEAKMTRRGLGARQIGEQLIIDIERYRSHPDCSALVAIVYDPDRHISNRRTLEADLSGVRDGLAVRVLVVQ